MAKNENELIDSVSKNFDIPFQNLSNFLIDTKNIAFVAELNNSAIGFAYCYSLMSLNKKPKLFVYSVDIIDSMQNKGIGSNLFQYIVDYSKDNGFSECFVITSKDNIPACRIYEKAGCKSEYENEIVYVINHK